MSQRNHPEHMFITEQPSPQKRSAERAIEMYKPESKVAERIQSTACSSTIRLIQEWLLIFPAQRNVLAQKSSSACFTGACMIAYSYFQQITHDSTVPCLHVQCNHFHDCRKTPTRHFKLIILAIRKETGEEPDLYYVSEVSLLTFNMLSMP